MQKFKKIFFIFYMALSGMVMAKFFIKKSLVFELIDLSLIFFITIMIYLGSNSQSEKEHETSKRFNQPNDPDPSK